VPVPFWGVEVSVPGPWFVAEGGSVPCWSPPPAGELLLGSAPATRCARHRSPATVARLWRIARLPVIRHPRRLVVNGVPVVVGRSTASALVWYLPDELEALKASGPQAHGLASTLRRSPRGAVLAAVGARPGAGWVSVSFGGLRARVPSRWTVERTDVTNVPLCRSEVGSLTAGQVLLDSDLATEYPPCPYLPPTAASLFGGGNGLRIDLLPARAEQGAGGLSRSCLHLGELRACPYRRPAMGDIELLVSGGGLVHPRLVWIGFAGSGRVAASVLSSLRGAAG